MSVGWSSNDVRLKHSFAMGVIGVIINGGDLGDATINIS